MALIENRRFLLLVVFGVLASTAVYGLLASFAATPTKCDQLASYSWDFERVAPVVSDDDLDLVAADAACRAAVADQPDNPRLKVLLARVTGNAGNRAEAIALLEEATTQDYPAALAVLGGMLVESEFDRAIELLEKAAILGHVTAQTMLANFYWDKNRAIYDPIIAREWAEKAAAQGDMRGQFALATILITEAGVVEDETPSPAEERAIELYGAAAAQGHIWADLMLGDLYLHRENYEKARFHYRRTVDTGLEVAKSRLADLLMEGLGGPVDEDEAIRLYCEAGKFEVDTAEILYGIEIDC